MFDRLDLFWLWDGIGTLPRSDRWQTQARSAVRDDLLTALAELTTTVIESAGGSVDQWLGGQRALGRPGPGDAHRDPPRRALRPDDPVGRPAPAPQPRPHQRHQLIPSECSASSECWERGRRAPSTRMSPASSVIGPMSPRFRIAPSPTGFFHVGGARTALYNWALARRLGGRFVLRIEDTDEARDRPEWTQGIVDALAWLGIGADDPVFEGPYFQSANAAAHVAAAERLFAAGHAYYCDLTGEQIQERAKAAGRQGYDGYSRDRGLGPAPGRVLRFRVPDGDHLVRDVVRGDVEFEHDAIEDFVLLRGNGTPDLRARQRRRRRRDGDHPRRARRRAPRPTLRSSSCCGRRSATSRRCGRTCRCSSTRRRKKLSKRRDKVALEQYRDEGYVADGDGQLPDDARLGAEGRHRDRAVGAHRGGVPAGGRHPLAGLLRPEEAGRLQRRVHPGDDDRRARRRLRSRGSPRAATATASGRSPRCCSRGS